MKVAPVSADLLVKLALGALLVGGLVYAARRAASGLADANHAIVNAAMSAAQSINPLNDNNVFAQGANAATSAIAGRPETLGGWIRGATSNDDDKIKAMLEGRPPATTGEVRPALDDLVDYRYF